VIVAERKPFEEIYNNVRKHKSILVLGCGSCVTVCMAGGEEEVGILSSQVELGAREKGDDISVIGHTIKRQCDVEFFDDETAKKIEQVDAVVSMACGVGVQFCVERFPDAIVYPALNTSFYGATMEQGVWAERCAGCGECVIEEFGGICPITRCSKSLLNGPCGGSDSGKCEVDPENLDCAWQLIIDRMDKLGRLEELEQVRPPKNWSKNRDGGPRTITREDKRL
jgi:hypothetical protein